MTLDLTTLSTTFRARPVDGFVNLAGNDPADTPFMEEENDAEAELVDELREQLLDAHGLKLSEAVPSTPSSPSGHTAAACAASVATGLTDLPDISGRTR